MDILLNEDNIYLLAYMHENAKAFDDHHPFCTETVIGEIGWSKRQYENAASYLAGFGLVAESRLRGGNWVNYFFTSQGENFMRHVDQALEQSLADKGKRLTAGALKEGGKVLRDLGITVASAILGKMISG